MEISTCFKYRELDARLIYEVMSIETNLRIDFFKSIANQLSDYAYWFVLSTLWIDDSQIAPISVWKKLFSDKRANQKLSLMKPNEVKAFNALPNKLTVYRAHSKTEKDWISYTLDKKTAIEFARRKQIRNIQEYKIKKNNCIALFLRREESEIICLDKNMAKVVNLKK